MQGVLIGWLVPRVGEVVAVLIGITALTAATLVFAFARADPIIYAALLVNGLQGLIQPAIAALNSRAVDAESQGELQGATQAVGSLAQIAGPPLYAIIFARFTGADAIVQFPGMPLIVATVIAIAAVALFVTGARRAHA